MGSANLVTKLLDVGSIIVILWFLSKEEMGVATLAWTVAIVLESFNGLGIGTAILQAKEISDRQLSTAWWYVMGLAVTLFLGILAASPLIAGYYEAPELTPMIIVSSGKLIFVGAALVPLQLLNKQLKFKEIGTIQTIATLFSSITKIVLAAAGFGAWALVIGYTAAGFFMAAGAYFFQPFAPRMVLAFSEIRHLVVFGIKVATSGIIYHFYRNADYLIVGRFLGKETLGVYRVAFDVAMTPAMTLLAVVNRTAFPVFSRLAETREKLADTFVWIQKNFAFLIAPIALFLTFSADDLMSLIGEAQWVEAAPAIRVLAWAALLRSLAQVFPQVYHATGRPEYAIYDSLISVVVLVGTFFGALWFFKETLGILSVSYAWLAVYPILIFFLWIFARMAIPLGMGRYLTSFLHPLAATAIAAAACAPIFYFSDDLPDSAILKVVAYAGTILAVTLGYMKLVLRTRFKDMLLRRDARAPDGEEAGDE